VIDIFQHGLLFAICHSLGRGKKIVTLSLGDYGARQLEGALFFIARATWAARTGAGVIRPGPLVPARLHRP
jgi:hypothetical protein